MATKQLSPLRATTALDVEELEAQLPDPIATEWALGATIIPHEIATAIARRNLLFCEFTRSAAILLHLDQ